MPNTEPDFVHVAVAIIYDDQGRVLLTRRPEHVHQGGLWEFPGGKLETGETVLRALERELQEEIGIQVTKAEPLICIRHRYDDRTVLLDTWVIKSHQGLVRACEGQAMQWIDPFALDGSQMPAADVPIINAIRLPNTCLITPDPADDLEGFLSTLELSLKSGVRLVQLRAKSLSDDAYLSLAQQVAGKVHEYQGQLLINRSHAMLADTNADGVHLTSAALMALSQRPVAADNILSASCHNAVEIEQANRLAIDMALVSPVQATPSHPDVEPIGWQVFSNLTDQARMPVYALGGVGCGDIMQARNYGAQGIASIRALWGLHE